MNRYGGKLVKSLKAVFVWGLKGMEEKRGLCQFCQLVRNKEDKHLLCAN